jgi:creatinine amidohydrolase
MLLHLSTWPEVDQYLQQSQGIIFPIGSTEQHGPTGLIDTDAICAEVVAHGVGDLITERRRGGKVKYHSGIEKTII